MNLGIFQATQDSKPFQTGTTNFTGGFDSGSESFPAPGQQGQNNGSDTNERAVRTFVAIHFPTEGNEEYHKSHFTKFLFRLIHPDKQKNDGFLEFWKAFKGTLKKNHMFTSSPAPYCFMLTIPQLNFILAKMQMQTDMPFNAKQLWDWFRPIGVMITEPSTQELYERVTGDHRNVVVMGPARTPNVWGTCTQGDHIYVLIKPIEVQANSVLTFRPTEDGQEYHVRNTKEKDMIWQFSNYRGSGFPPITEVKETIKGNTYTGTFYRLGMIKDTFVENHNSLKAVMSGFYKNANNAESNVNRDEQAVSLLPHVYINVNCVSPSYY
jgi:hypothetical protein